MEIQEVIALMNEIGAKLAGPAQHVLELWLKQIVIFGVVDIVVGAVLLIGAIMGIRLEKEDLPEITCIGVLFIGMGIGLIIRGAMLVANPEYWFIKDVLGIVVGGG